MYECIKVDFFDDDKFTIYYVSNNIFKTEEEFKIFFKMLNNELRVKYDYEFDGFYEVTIYSNKGIYVLEFELVDDYGMRDFDITLYVNSVILYEFYDIDLIGDIKIYYNGNYYVEAEKVVDDIRVFEYGKFVYGELVNEILNNGFLLDK